MAQTRTDDGIFEEAGVSYLRSRFAELPIGEIVLAGPRTARFMMHAASRHLRRGDQRYPEIPTRLMTFGTATSVLLDELVLAFMASTRLEADEATFDRYAEETRAANAMLEAAGIFADPRRLHPAPPAPEVKIRPRTYRGIRYQDVSFDSGYEPVLDLPGTTRWQSTTSNQIAHAYVLRHREPRPWFVNLHGFGMGNASDLLALRALHYHRDLGLNVIHPVFPTHGPRSGGPDGEQALTLDYLNNLHSVSQAIWDVRRIMAWARAEAGATSFAVHGVSMGGFLAALVAGVVDDLSCVIAGVPTVDLAWVMRRNVPDEERPLPRGSGAARPHGGSHPRAHLAALVRAASAPLRRFVYAGVVDRVATPGQAHRLWKQLGKSRVLWYRGSHLGFAWSREVRKFIDDALLTSGVTRDAKP